MNEKVGFAAATFIIFFTKIIAMQRDSHLQVFLGEKGLVLILDFCFYAPKQELQAVKNYFLYLLT